MTKTVASISSSLAAMALKQHLDSGGTIQIPSLENDQQKTIVTFDMWGQRCETVFDDTSELTPLTWLRTMFDKGWLRPVEVRLENGPVLYTQEQILKLFEE